MPLEFSRISAKREGALTLVIDTDHGRLCTVQYAISHRTNPADAINDLRIREGTSRNRIGFWYADATQTCEPPVPSAIPAWAIGKNYDVVVWTGLPRNFEEKADPPWTVPFSVDAAQTYLQGLPADGKALAVEYLQRAPGLVQTPLRDALADAAWFPPPAE